jgi:hypothetical protein
MRGSSSKVRYLSHLPRFTPGFCVGFAPQKTVNSFRFGSQDAVPARYVVIIAN